MTIRSSPQAMHRKTQLAGELAARILGRWSDAWREVLASALGAALAWVLAVRLLGHSQPIFAPISAIICLSPGLPSYTKQTMGLLLGVATGIVIGELALALPDSMPLLRIALAGFFAMIVAASYGQLAVVPIQAGVSAILIVTYGAATTGSVRMADVAVGAVVGLFFGQVLRAPERSQRAKADYRLPQARAVSRNPEAAAARWITYLCGNVKRLRGPNARFRLSFRPGKERGQRLDRAIR
jgi:fusaric acid resistance family protein